VPREKGIDTIGIVLIDAVGASPAVLRRRTEQLIEGILQR